MMAHLVAYDQGFEDGRLLIIYGSIYDHGGGAHGHFWRRPYDVKKSLMSMTQATWSLK